MSELVSVLQVYWAWGMSMGRRGHSFGGRNSPLRVLALPAAGAERIAACAEFHRTRAGAFEDVGHHAHAAGVVGGDLGDVLGEGVEFAEDGHGAAGAAAGDLGAVEAVGGAALADG